MHFDDKIGVDKSWFGGVINFILTIFVYQTIGGDINQLLFFKADRHGFDLNVCGSL